ncbi:hypothetical protein COB21_05440 [Candidatus Aerophobetes bacterium]|uniref:Methyltransferase FkbM domain-containing protein n=1 Tax=Aerophobetes bacterium TaxID=2030807 RepID=A0A2A4WZH3_UNCAE|nr:MAG: hypothetical protein COB21_05440 [Candidatus Aerophobetes bacterium]
MKKIFLSLLIFPLFLFGEYHGQFLQDKYMNEHFFKNKKQGVFVDIGAHLPVQDSNTYFFENEMQWTGLCIDPHPVMFKQLKNKRTCKCLEVAVVPFTEGHQKFLQLDKLAGLSGLIGSYGEQDTARINKDSKLHGGKQQVINVKTVPINQILSTHKLFHIDFLSLDIEGGELDILKALDFDTFFIDVITVENNWEDAWHCEAKNSSIRKYMETAGYRYVTRLGVDEVYKKI